MHEHQTNVSFNGFLRVYRLFLLKADTIVLDSGLLGVVVH